MPQTVAGITLSEGETVQHDFRPRWGVLMWCIALGIGVPTVGIGFVALWWTRRFKTRYIVTNKRVIRKRGVLSTSTDEFRLSDVSRVQTSRSFRDRLVMTGSIRIDTGPDAMRIKRVPRHAAVAGTIRSGQTA